jgi:hypothetical protein
VACFVSNIFKRTTTKRRVAIGKIAHRLNLALEHKATLLLDRVKFFFENFMIIPNFAPNGTLPPFIDGSPTDPAKRSPFGATMYQLIDRFCTTSHRAILLKGLNAYRKHLFEGGFVTGYQWIDGSFVEDVENTRGRPPGDIDVVTLFNRPLKYQHDATSWFSAYSSVLHAKYFETRNMKPVYKCDTFAIDLDAGHISLVRDTMYWGGLFTDIRGSSEKKGIVSIPLACDPMEFKAVDHKIGGKFDV